MSDMLSVGAGAAEGLKEYLNRLFLEDKFHEEQRQARAHESLGERQLSENVALRRMTQESLNNERIRQNEDRDDARATTRQNAIRGMVFQRPTGTEVSPEDFNRETTEGGVAKDFYEQGAYGGMTGDDASEPRNVIKFRGTSAQQNQADMQAVRDLNANLAGHRENRLADWGPPTATIGDTSLPGGAKVVRRNEVPAGGAAAPQPAAQREKIDAYKNTLQMIKDIRELGDKIQWRGLGVLAGPVGTLRMRVTGGGDTDEERLRNRLSRLRAQASFQEGGKQFTSTESDLINQFLAQVNSNPRAAVTRLDEFERNARNSLKELGVDLGGEAITDKPTEDPDDPLGMLKPKK